MRTEQITLIPSAAEAAPSLMIPQGKRKREQNVMWKGRPLQQGMLILHAQRKAVARILSEHILLVSKRNELYELY